MHKQLTPFQQALVDSVLKEYADILPNSGEVERLFIEFLQAYRCSMKQA